MFGTRRQMKMFELLKCVKNWVPKCLHLMDSDFLDTSEKFIDSCIYQELRYPFLQIIKILMKIC